MNETPEKSFHNDISVVFSSSRAAKRQKIEKAADVHPNLVVHTFKPHQSGKDGPITFNERFFWARRAWKLLEAWQRDLLVENLKKLCTSTHFSGMAGFELILEEIVEEVRSQTGLPLHNIKGCHACDREFSRQKVIAALPKHCRPHHIYTDIQDRLPKALQDMIEDKLPGSDAHLEISRFAYKEIDDIVKDHYQSKRICGECAPCVLHPSKVQSGGCRLYSDPDFEAQIVVLDEEVPAELRSENSSRFRVHAAGVPCKDVSSFGKGLAKAGPCMVAQSIWVHERAAQHEDFTFCECTYLWDPTCLCEAMPSHFEVHLALLDPHGHFGDGIRRLRWVSAVLNRATAICV